MGIAGLLPALKSIQKQRHLSEFSGKKVAIDAYVFLHRGVYTCSTELALDEPTTKYVRYAMAKFRLLRHHGIEPYIVFDGGPLPAKKGTEVERKQRREEALRKGKLLASQGKSSQARDCFTKCVDVTPQMAFQLIKALRQEKMEYVVAPYEADAQLAYLEREGIVDAILTEDSDLLVFGCQNVLFKMDAASSTVTHISRSDFGSITGAGNDISLVGWNDSQFRMMAILSGCDYLPSIPGIGLKTACTLLRKWKTAEKVVKAIQLEGKKRVPKEYLAEVSLAEKCFLHQRVFDPRTRQLVHLTEVEQETWDTVSDTYVGPLIETALARLIAIGEADPATYQPMVDINPAFLRPLTDVSNAKAIAVGKPNSKTIAATSTPKPPSGILAFFGPNAIIPRSKSPTKPSSKPPPKSGAGKASGKRTLAEVMDQDLAAKKQKHETQESRFFGGFPTPGASTSRQPIAGDKENTPIVVEDDDEVDEEDGSLIVHVREDEGMVIFSDDEDIVEQEDGYISPASADSDGEELSSPVRPGAYEALESVSSPLGAFKGSGPPRSMVSPTPRRNQSLPQPSTIGVNLNDIFRDDEDTNLTDGELEEDVDDIGPSPSPTEVIVTVESLSDPEEEAVKGHNVRTRAVATGWRQKWALQSTPSLRRSTTNVTPAGRHRLSLPQDSFSSNSSAPVTPVLTGPVRTARGRKSFPLEPVAKSSTTGESHRLDKFRCG